MRIALGYHSRVGKDTAADIITTTLDKPPVRLRFAQVLYNIVNYIQQEYGISDAKKDPTLMQKLGDLLREHYNDDINTEVVRRILQTTDPSANILITDLRFLSEYKLLKSYGFILIKIVRKCRTIDRCITHRSETELDGCEFDYIVENDGTMEEFSQKIMNIINNIHHDK